MDAALIRFVRLALAVLSERIITLVGLLMAFSLSCWTMFDPNYERLAMAAFFSVFAFLLVKTKERKPSETEN